MNILEQLKTMTKVVADTGDFETMKAYKPIDATTNPSLIYAAAQKEEYAGLVDDAIAFCKRASSDKHKQLEICLDKLAVNFGLEILKIVEGRVSTEADARLSFSTERTVQKARELIALYKQKGIDPKRILIKIASTWEGIKAAEILEREGIHCNCTLLFGFAQAVACAESGVKLISPFVGRIMDWHKNARGVESIPAAEDPGVHSVQKIYRYFKKYGYPTEVMGASFRNTSEIIELSGCDLLTIAPKLMKELEGMSGTLIKKLDTGSAGSYTGEKLTLDESSFRWMMNEDAMATEKLAEGIRNFSRDLEKLEEFVSGRLG